MNSIVSFVFQPDNRRLRNSHISEKLHVLDSRWLLLFYHLSLSFTVIILMLNIFSVKTNKAYITFPRLFTIIKNFNVKTRPSFLFSFLNWQSIRIYLFALYLFGRNKKVRENRCYIYSLLLYTQVEPALLKDCTHSVSTNLNEKYLLV